MRKIPCLITIMGCTLMVIVIPMVLLACAHAPPQTSNEAIQISLIKAEADASYTPGAIWGSSESQSSLKCCSQVLVEKTICQAVASLSESIPGDVTTIPGDVFGLIDKTYTGDISNASTKINSTKTGFIMESRFQVSGVLNPVIKIPNLSVIGQLICIDFAMPTSLPDKPSFVEELFTNDVDVALQIDCNTLAAAIVGKLHCSGNEYTETNNANAMNNVTMVLNAVIRGLAITDQIHSTSQVPGSSYGLTTKNANTKCAMVLFPMLVC